MTKTSLQTLLEDAIRRTQSLSKASRMTGVPYHEVLRYRPQTQHTFYSTNAQEPADIRTLGRPGMQHYVIAVKRAGCGWPRKYDEAIQRARRLFDFGSHEMAQGSFEGWVIQYLIPRKKPTKTRKFFDTWVT